ncbi:uncharacterized protein EV422DRAFT_570157 [Fimicolochytrium jonesii]|uniref:uncharacterized protein n=1 Tax=Fimicolochytrium jonesii TaxID=1396493 RepID=UPI0022FE3693|nr:uncharacterized protein EV422DRAFT_570157 [Fimicolochytrium jonesii]KAI8818011.1 hypothetical protein EV422DRAFT_570157 [Fimicolochytrium jonesii]
MQSHVGNDWNSHGIGQTLLGNWVEDRAVGDVLLQERQDFVKLGRAGHQGILTHSPNEHTYTTSHGEAHARKPGGWGTGSAGHDAGKQQRLIDAELMKRALAETAKPPEERKSAAGWTSTNKADFGHEDIYGKTQDLGTHAPSESDKQRFAQPITFWSDYATKGTGHTISSSKAAFLHQRSEREAHSDCPRDLGFKAGLAHQHHASAAPVRFGKHTDFSTPIGEFDKAAVKDV